jgi:site-specific DNA-methyltransferase (adenine-specific)
MTAPTTVARNELLVGDALDRLRALPDHTIDSVVTSPPYFRLRNYDADGQLGLEAHVDQWVEKLAAISAEVHRVLVPTGTYWLNLGDTYAAHPSQGAARKSLVMAPERLALHLQEAGWIIRNKIIWAKPNPVPSSIPDRLNCTYEVIYVLSNQSKYFLALLGSPWVMAPSGRAVIRRGGSRWRS